MGYGAVLGPVFLRSETRTDVHMKCCKYKVDQLTLPALCVLGDERERVDEGVRSARKRVAGCSSPFVHNLRLVVAIWQIIVLQRGLVRWELSLKFSHEANGFVVRSSLSGL